MSNLSGLPPAALARAASVATTQAIAVRVIALPDSGQGSPQTLTGTVKGQTPDGQLQIETTRGILNILLKDRGSLPVGQRIEIDIPAGRPPLQALLRSEPSATPDDVAHLPNPVIAADIRLDRPLPVKPDDISEALVLLEPTADPRLAAPLQPGQILRLLPLPLAVGGGPSPMFQTPAEIFTSLVNALAEATDISLQIKQNIIQVLSRIDVSTLLTSLSEGLPSAPQTQIEKTFQTLAQSLDVPTKSNLQNAASPNQPPPFFNIAKPLDVQIVAFQTNDFKAALVQAETPAVPPQILQNFVSLPQTAAAPQSPALLGQVVGFTAQGQPILSLTVPGSTVPQNYTVQFVTDNVAEGAPVIVAPVTVPPARPGLVPLAIGTAQTLADWVQPEIWDPVQTLIATVAHINPAMAQTMAQMLPSAAHPRDIGALSLFFLSMMRSGDFDAWVGPPAIDLLKRNGKIDLLRALAGESVMTSRLDAAPLPGEWRATLLPFWHDQQVHKLPLFYKHWKDDTQGEDNVREDRRKKMRFLFELKLSRMGPVQVDGFMSREKLDMILRTKSMVSPPMQDALRKTYHASMQRSNLSGEMTFQFKP